MGNESNIPKNLNKKTDKIKKFLSQTKELTRKELLGILLLTGIASGTAGYVLSEYNSNSQENKKEQSEKIEQSKIINSHSDFIKYITNNDLSGVPRTRTLGRYLRVLRYEKEINSACQEYNISCESLFGLTMVESQGNPASINEHDGGAGFIHFQPDVYARFVRDIMKEEVKLFTDNEPYSKYDFKKLKKAGRSKRKIYEKHGDELNKFIRQRGMQELENADDRFNYKKIIRSSAAYLQYIKNQFVLPNYEKETKSNSWNKFKNDKEFDFLEMLTLNGFNKGPSNFTKNFGGNKDEIAGMHIQNIKGNMRDMRYYEKKLDSLVKEGLTGEEIISELATMYQKVGKSKDGMDMFKYDGPKSSHMQMILNFNSWENYYNHNMYKPIGFANIIDKEGNALDEKKEITDRDNVYIKVRDIFDIQQETDSKGNTMFKYLATDTDAVKDVIHKFNRRNEANNMQYINAVDTSITDIYGNQIKKLRERKDIIIKTKPSIKK